MKKTPLYDTHVALSAKMVEFGGWQMPVQYSGILAEHTATRGGAGLFDTCHMGEFRVEGPQAAAFLDTVITRRIRDMEIGECRYGLICNEQGGIIDDSITCRTGEESFMVVVNAGTKDGDFAHFQAHLPDKGVLLDDVSETTGKIDVQGPKAAAILSSLTDVELGGLPYFFFTEGSVAGVRAIVSRTGYTGEPGFELYLPADETVAVWNAILGAGRDAGMAPAGLGARDTLRLEACLPLYGNDMNVDINPYEADLGWCVRSKKKGLVGGRAMQAVRAAGPSRRLTAFRMETRAPARRGYPVCAPGGGAAIGRVTSGSFCPTVGASVGLALLKIGHAEPGNEIEVEIRGKRHRARTVEKPFYRNEAVRT